LAAIIRDSSGSLPTGLTWIRALRAAVRETGTGLVEKEREYRDAAAGSSEIAERVEGGLSRLERRLTTSALALPSSIGLLLYGVLAGGIFGIMATLLLSSLDLTISAALVIAPAIIAPIIYVATWLVLRFWLISNALSEFRDVMAALLRSLERRLRLLADIQRVRADRRTLALVDADLAARENWLASVSSILGEARWRPRPSPDPTAPIAKSVKIDENSLLLEQETVLEAIRSELLPSEERGEHHLVGWIAAQVSGPVEDLASPIGLLDQITLRIRTHIWRSIGDSEYLLDHVSELGDACALARSAGEPRVMWGKRPDPVDLVRDVMANEIVMPRQMAVSMSVPHSLWNVAGPGTDLARSAGLSGVGGEGNIFAMNRKNRIYLWRANLCWPLNVTD